jgi:sulfur-carrier protein
MKVLFFAYIRDYTKCKDVDMDCCHDIRSLLEKLSEKYGQGFRHKIFKGENLSSEIIILINGRHISHLDGMSTELHEDDEISIFPVVAGG